MPVPDAAVNEDDGLVFGENVVVLSVAHPDAGRDLLILTGQHLLVS